MTSLSLLILRIILQSQLIRSHHNNLFEYVLES